jgi:hypothetical protein
MGGRVRCGHCGHENPSHFLTCGQCGELVKPRVDPQAVEPAGTTASPYDNLDVRARRVEQVTMTSRAGYRMPEVCACCLADGITRETAVATRRSGNEVETLTLEYPLCVACADHVKRGQNQPLLALALTVVVAGAGIGVHAWRHTVSPTAVLIWIAIALAAGTALYTWLSHARPPQFGPRCAPDLEPFRITRWDEEYITFECAQPDWADAFRRANFA